MMGNLTKLPVSFDVIRRIPSYCFLASFRVRGVEYENNLVSRDFDATADLERQVAVYVVGPQVL